MGKKKNYVLELNKYARRAHWDLKYEDLESEGLRHRFLKRAVVNGQGFPVGVGDSAKKAKQNAAKNALRHLHEKENPIPGVSSWSALSDDDDDDAPVRPSTPPNAPEYHDAKTKSETPSDFVDFTSSSTPAKDQDAVVRKNAKTGNGSNEKTSTQSEISRFESEFDCKAANLLGKGAFGVVFKAKHKLTKMDYAVKIVRFKNVEKALREVIALSNLHHSNIVRYYTCWLEDSGYQGDNAEDTCSSSESSMDYSFRYLYIKMELCDTKTLRVWIEERNTQNVKKPLRASKRVDERFIQLFLQLASGVEYIHSKMLIHRDLKPANIMFGENGEVKIGDFGLVANENNDDAENLLERTGCKGTPSYMAPEQV
ncbi:hypothetical protein FQN60_015200, partial [Etheostoma spectabile]